MTRPSSTAGEWTPEHGVPPVGTVLEVGSVPAPLEGFSGDLLTFTHLSPNHWVVQHNLSPRMEPVTLEEVAFWAPLRVIGSAQPQGAAAA